jgi:ribosomal protein S18 acetylase RimI-like enzyme
MRDSIVICLADYADSVHAAALVAVLDAYASDPMGGGEGLSDYAKRHVVAGLAVRPQAFSVLAFADTTDRQCVGLVNCIEGFSTFAARPLVNVHDVAVLAAFRGQGIAQRMLQFAEVVARQRGACKLTLEVLSGNKSARQLYQNLGFEDYALDPAAGQAQFMQKWLN